MFALRRLIQQHALSSLWALTFALLLSTGWGQVHRVLHSGAQGFASVETSAKAAVPALGDEEGSSLCKLLDHLSHGAGPVLAVAVLLAEVPSDRLPVLRVSGIFATAAQGFDARAPPRHP